MRAGPLSSPQVIDLLNARFIPVFAVNEDYRKGGAAPAEERAEYDRIYREALKRGLSAGTVHAYVVSPSGHPTASLHVAEASKTDRLLAMLTHSASALKAPESGPPLVKPHGLSVAPKAGPGSVVLHLTARGHGSSWDEFPSENWIVLGPEQLTGLLPPDAVKTGKSWDIREDLATAILTHFYPQTENNDVSTHRFTRRGLRGELVGVEGGVARARLAGDLEMTHAFYPGRKDDNVVRAHVVGWLEYEPATRQVRRLRLVTDDATYGKGTLDVAVRSVP